MTIIDKPGVYDIPLADYLADPCPAPSLNAGVANLLVERSPRHAWTAHPRLNPNYRAERDRRFDLGSAVHAALLGAGNGFALIEADSYKTKAAQEARDQAYAADRIPLLPRELETVEAIAVSIHEQMAVHGDVPIQFGNDKFGLAEQTLCWQEGPVWCRIRLDWMASAKRGPFVDLKTTNASAHPDSWGSTGFWNLGCDMTAGLYRRGISRVLGIEDPEFLFVVAEVKPPYAVSVCAPSPATLHMADFKAGRAIGMWTRCLEAGRWPGYVGKIAYIEPPIWLRNRAEDRYLREQVAEEAGEDLFALAIDWQAPL